MGLKISELHSLRLTGVNFNRRMVVPTNLEENLEAPHNWKSCIPPWFKSSGQDWEAIVCSKPFTSFSYGLRCAIIVEYFHR